MGELRTAVRTPAQPTAAQEHYSELVRRGGAEILLVPSAFTVPTGQAHWEVCDLRVPGASGCEVR